MVPPGSGGPGGEESGGETEERRETQDGEAAPRALDGLLRVALLILRGVGKRDGGAVHDADLMSAPEVLVRESAVGLGHDCSVNVVEDFQGESGAGLTVRTILDWRQGLSGAPAKRGGLVDSLATGGTRLSDLPEESPESESESPAAAAGMRTLVALGEEVVRDPALEEKLELVQEGTLAGSGVAAQALELSGKVRSEGWEVGSHLGQLLYCPIDRTAKLKG